MARWLRIVNLSMALVAGCVTTDPCPPDCPMPACAPGAAPTAAPPCGPPVLPPEPHLAGPHPVEFYVTTALARNPEIQAMGRRVAAQAQVVPQVTTLPDPMLGNTFWPIPEHSPQTASGRMVDSLGVSQQFPWCGKLQLRGEVADFDTRIALTQLTQTQLKVIEQVKQSYYDIFFYQQAIQITQEDEKLLRLYLSAAEARYKTGAVSQQDVLRVQVEMDKVRDQLIQLRQELQLARADLARLLSIGPETELQTAEALQLPPVPEHVHRLYELAAAARPEMRERLLAISREQRTIDLAKLEYYPDITVGIGWDIMTRSGAIAPTADGKDNLGFTVSFNLPVWHHKYAAGVREAQERTASNARLYESTRDETFRLVRRLTVQARALEQEIALFHDDIIPRAEQTLRAASADYRVGKVTILELLDNWGQLLRFRIQLIRLETGLGQVLASLERVLGMQLADLLHPAGTPCPPGVPAQP